MRSAARCALAIAAAATLAAIPACGKKSTDPGALAGDPIVTEPANAVTRTIGPDGGQLSSAAGDGTQYVLEIPTGALAAPVEIRMTPVSSLRDLPLAGGMAGAVQLEPSGLVFARSAVLRVKGPLAGGPGQRLIGFGASSDADTFTVELAAAAAGEIAVFVRHFSVAGAGFGTTADLALFPGTNSFSMGSAVTALLGMDLPADREQAVQVARSAFTTVLLPGLQLAANDGALLQAVSDYETWRILIDMIANGGDPVVPPLAPPGQPPAPVEHLVIPELATELAQAGEAGADALRLAIGGNNDVCAGNASFTALANVFFWQRQAPLFGVADAAHGLDVPSVLEGLCAQVELVSQDLPSTLQVGFPHSLDLRFGVRFGNGTLAPAPFEVSVTATGLAVQNPEGFSDAAGNYTTVVEASAAGAIGIRARACLVLPGSKDASPVCAEFEVTGSSSEPPIGLDLSGSYNLQLPGVSCALFCCQVAGHTGSMTLTQSGNAVTGNWTTTHACGINLVMGGSYSATLATNEFGQPALFNVSLVVATTNQSGVCLQQMSPFRGDGPFGVSVNGTTGELSFGNSLTNSSAAGDCGAEVGEALWTLTARRLAPVPAP